MRRAGLNPIGEAPVLAPGGEAIPLGGGTATAQAVSQAIQESIGFPLYDIGDYFCYKGVPVRKVNNGISSRYMPGALRLNADIPQPNLTDSTSTATQTLGTITIPGGTLVGKTQAIINATFSCPAQWGTTSSLLFMEIITPDNTNLQFFLGTTSGASATSQSFTNVTLRGVDSSTLSVGSAIAPVSGGSSKRCNLLKDISIRFAFKAATGFTRAVSLTSATLDILDSITVPQASAAYRNPIQQPFKTSSFWNTPLGNGAVFQLATDLETSSILTDSPGGVNAGAFAWISGYSGGANNFVQLNSTDPFCNFTYQSRCTDAPWPFAATASGNGSFKMRAPAQEFITGQSSDRVVTLISPDKRYMIESGSYSYNAVTNTHMLGYCTVWDLYGTGNTNSINTAVLPLLSEGYRGSGHPLCGGIIRKSELDNLQINHVVALQLSNYQQKAAVFLVVGAPAGGTSFSIKSVDSLQTAQSYASLFKSGTNVYFNGATYTLTADSTYDAPSNTTNFTVSTTITGAATNLYLGGTDSTSQKKTQFVWPATSVDNGSLSIGGAGLYRGLVPMGAMFGIPSNVDLSTIGVTSQEGMALARAFQQYGGINNDTTVGTFSLCFLESGMTVAQRANLYADRVAIRNALRMITNISAANPGGPGARIAPWPAELQPLY